MEVTIRFCGGKYNGKWEKVSRLEGVYCFFDTTQQIAIVYVRDADSLNYYYNKEKSKEFSDNFAVAYQQSKLMEQTCARAVAERLAKAKRK